MTKKEVADFLDRFPETHEVCISDNCSCLIVFNPSDSPQMKEDGKYPCFYLELGGKTIYLCGSCDFGSFNEVAENKCPDCGDDLIEEGLDV